MKKLLVELECLAKTIIGFLVWGAIGSTAIYYWTGAPLNEVILGVMLFGFLAWLWDYFVQFRNIMLLKRMIKEQAEERGKENEQ